MGYYIQTNSNIDKSNYIMHNHGAREVSRNTFLDASAKENGLIVVVDNGLFEAAAFCYSDREKMDFCNENDRRPKRFLVMDRKLAEKLSGF